ncbi:helix-turn-helix domain-containing protein [Modicisalibacter luteus]|uniref:Helix-turn-helix domain-containing protein n=1 Tax=Modicisalibacter luteus TaxID=453962 RepID=A0ABV7M5W8_9GAMM|nr:helix-turn-helix domain-containing protein [Halomonas lutea]
MPTKHLSPEMLNERRRQAVRLRLDGYTVAETARHAELSAPTVSAAWKAFREGGWGAIDVKPRGRRSGQGDVLGDVERRTLCRFLADWPDDGAPGWTSRALANAIQGCSRDLASPSPRTIEHWLKAQDLKPEPLALEALAHQRSHIGRWYRQQVQPVLRQMQRTGGSAWQGGVRVAKPGAVPTASRLRYQFYLHGKRGALLTRCLPASPRADDYLMLFQRMLSQKHGAPIALVFHGAFFEASPEIRQWLVEHPAFHLINVPSH